jgi:hypothetical protein
MRKGVETLGRRRTVLLVGVLLVVWVAVAEASGTGLALTDAGKRKLDQAWSLTLRKKKGPYTQNFCVCQDGAKKPVQLPDGRIVSPCNGNARFCAAFREPWAKSIAEERMFIANLFARDLWQWEDFPDHHDLVRGYILEKFFVETHPNHKLAEMRAYGGLAGAEYEARDAPLFFEKYLGLETFTEPRHYLLAYELQRRFYVRAGLGDIVKVRNLASAIHRERQSFKPLRDAVHNQISAALVPRIQAYRDKVPAGGTRDRIDELVREIEALTRLDESAMRVQLAEIEDPALRARMTSLMPADGVSDLQAAQVLAGVMVAARETVDAKQVSVADRRRVIDLAIMASAILQQRSTRIVDALKTSARDLVELLSALTEGAYGSGLLMARERVALVTLLDDLATSSRLTRREVERALARAARAIEWAQATTLYAFEEVRAPWGYLLPDTALIPDDVLRGSPLLVYGRALARLQDWAVGGDPIRHDIFGAALDRGVRALNPGVAVGPLKVAPSGGDYSREYVVALPETPADLEPAAGIFTRGEGNVVSHVQLLARALGIPNVVLAANVYEMFAVHDGHDVFFISTPGGRVIVKEVAGMTADDYAVLAEYRRNEKRAADGSLEGGAAKLHIDKARLDLSDALALDLASVRRGHSGIRCGPKAAFLGELKHLFPENVARGVVVPFGAYYAHYKRARVAMPPELSSAGIAKAGDPLPAFVERTYAEFFGKMIPSGADEKTLAAWIRPRLAVIRHSIEQQPLADDLQASIRSELARLGLLSAADPTQTVGVFIRSDTNVEDLDNFNGAGLNLTLFNRRSLADIYAGLKEVWASPFTYRSFSWRQTLIDEPLWVLPSVVILESVPTEKSGVLVTADVDGDDEQGMLIATSEGVGGAVDGTPAETLVWSKGGVELVTMFKSPYRRLLQAGSGTEILPSSGRESVLDADELRQLTSAAELLRTTLTPSRGLQGKARPWDIEFGFSKGKLWLFQVRPFIGNDSLQNVAALAAFEAPRAGAGDILSLDDTIP